MMDPLIEWLRSPIWVWFMAILLLVIAVIIGLAARGHGTTVLKE